MVTIIIGWMAVDTLVTLLRHGQHWLVSMAVGLPRLAADGILRYGLAPLWRSLSRADKMPPMDTLLAIS